ncbi:HutD/Ves family protein [Amycolatopsis benzoatilytica]|uniref:HutD/Ves family protein n=1 Tax=Amycolatopsis benzoatilytica TaxID=346045 RepID=UPI00037A87D9|nr:HutD family protein [Amycolatopsis benzoatilytica]
MLNPSDFPPVPWRNGAGTTRELAAATTPSGGLRWRISVADLARDAPFSAFPGTDRLFTALGALRLTVNGTSTGLAAGEQLRFAGEDDVAVALDQPTRALNVMTARGVCRAEVVLRSAASPGEEGAVATVDLGERVADVFVTDLSGD